MFKNMVRAGKSGMTYDFFMYDSKHSAGSKNYGAEESVSGTASEKPKLSVIFGSYFSAFPLLMNLHSMGIPTAATFRTNRIAGCLLKADKDLKKSSKRKFLLSY